MTSRLSLAAVAAVLALSVLPLSRVTAQVGPSESGPEPSELIAPNGIWMVGPDAIQFRPETEDQATAFDAALRLALDNREHMGYPWVDLKTRTLHLRAVDEVGQAGAGSAEDQLSKAGLTVMVEMTTTSIADLDKIADDATRLAEPEVPSADLIWKTEPDQRDNRIVITIGRVDQALMEALDRRFGNSLIAVRVQERGSASSAGRDSDIPPFWGGAKITTPSGGFCTTGFAWTVGSLSAMLTAAHCAPSGGTLSYPGYPGAGTVAIGSEENWSLTSGTQYYTGQSVYRGDVALIRYVGYSSSPRIYSGDPGTGTNTGVWDMFSRRSELGDSACVSGVVTGLWCGVVAATGLNVKYFGDGDNVWARNMVEDDSPGWTCPHKGDSGSPVFSIRDDGNVRAKGIFSGFLPIGIECSTWYTDIWDSYYGLPGSMKHL